MAAALAALRNGMRVVMTEETDWLGGQMTSQIVVLANPEVADKVRVAFLLSIPMFALLGCVGGGFLGFLSPSCGASA